MTKTQEGDASFRHRSANGFCHPLVAKAKVTPLQHMCLHA